MLILENSVFCLRENTIFYRCVIFLIISVHGFYSFYFKVNEDTFCKWDQLPPPWISYSEISCLMECKTRFEDRCCNVIFNTYNLTCTPVHPLSKDSGSLPSQPGDVQYASEDEERTLECDTEAGFKLHAACGTAVCLQARPKSKYFDAAKDCLDRNAVIFAPNTYECFALFESVSPPQSWAGLTFVSGTRTWQTGGVVDSEFYDFMRTKGQPNRPSTEKCALYSHWVPFQKLHDYPCNFSYGYFCEQNY